MIKQPAFPVEAWCVREVRLDLDLLAQSESLFALSNGHIGLRGNLDEGEPHGISGTYLNSFYELRPLPHSETAYGYPESSQTIVNVTNGKLIRLLVNDEPFDVRYGQLHTHERALDLRSGVLTRTAEWESPAGALVRVRARRVVSFTQRAVAAIEYQVEPVSGPVRLILQSELVANEAQPRFSADPRAGATLDRPLVPLEHDLEHNGAFLLHRTRESGLTMAAAMDHIVEGPAGVLTEFDVRPDWARANVVCYVEPGHQLRVVKLLAYGWSGLRSHPSLRDQVAAALVGARYTGFEGLLEDQRAYLDDFWDTADVEIDGDDDLQQAVRFALFHVLQAGARAEGRAIPAKGLTGPGYDGHTFRDTEGFVLPVLTYTLPRAAADALRWRFSTLELAKGRAATLGFRGATFPWRTIEGQECSGYWPASTAGVHINADIAEAVERYRIATGDETLEQDCGLAVLVETARLWISLGHYDRHRRWHVHGVTGPDEYTALVDDNVFTNLMAARNLRAAAGAVGRCPDQAARLDVTEEEATAWLEAAGSVFVPFDEEAGVHEQSAGFTRHPEWDFESNRDTHPLLLTAPYFELYRRQVVKQADLVLAMHWCGDRFTPEQKARNLDYYERRTVRDSSLSACTQAVIAAEVGHLELAHHYAHEAALVDLRDLHHNTGSGIHMASLAGAWISTVAGFGGLRDHEGVLSFDPALPERISTLRFALRWRTIRLEVVVTQERVRYSVRDGELTLRHAGRDIEVRQDSPAEFQLRQRRSMLPTPPQPPGRAPAPYH